MARIRRGLKASIVALAILLLVIMLALTLLGTVAAGLTIIMLNVITGQASAWNPTDALVGTGRAILVGLITCLYTAGLAIFVQGDHGGFKDYCINYRIVLYGPSGV